METDTDTIEIPQMATRNERLRWAVETYGPDGGTPRAFQRAVRTRMTSVTCSFHAVVGYLEKGRIIPDKFLDAAAGVLGPCTAEWLKDGGEMPDGSGVVAGHIPPKNTAPAGPMLTEATVEEAQAAGSQDEARIPDPFAMIRAGVEAATRAPLEQALKDLDPKYPRRGQSVRNWQILYDVVSGRTVDAVAADVGLSAVRVQAIVEEYSALVVKAVGG
jgi:hypothetical protein